MLAAPAQGAMTAPVPLDPGNGASFQAIPPFAWSPVPGADQYQFQVAADQNFNSPVLGQGEGTFPKSDFAAKRVMSLPMDAFLDEATQDRIVAAVRAAA